jgi:hypothetical protein
MMATRRNLVVESVLAAMLLGLLLFLTYGGCYG